MINNLIESGIEVVWFSDMTQSDVVWHMCSEGRETDNCFLSGYGQ